MLLSRDQQQVKTLLTETIKLLCKNGLHFESEFSIEGVIGITVDRDKVFLISINDTVRSAGQMSDDAETVCEPTGDCCKSRPVRLSSDNNQVSMLTSADLTKRAAPSAGRQQLQCTVQDYTLTLDTLADKKGLERTCPRQAKCSVTASCISHVEGRKNKLDKPIDVSAAAEGDEDELMDDDKRGSKSQQYTEATHCVDQKLNVIVQSNAPWDQSSGSCANSAAESETNLSLQKIKDEPAFDSDDDVVVTGELSSNYPVDDKIPGYSLQKSAIAGCSSFISPSSQLQVELVAGSGVYVSQSFVAQCETLNGSKLVRRLVRELFPDSHLLANSSCLGKRPRTTQHVLDPLKVNAIKVFAQSRCTELRTADIVQLINNVCTETRRTLRTLLH